MMPLFVNQVDFEDERFVAHDSKTKYVRSDAHEGAVLKFPSGVPALGDVVLINVSWDSCGRRGFQGHRGPLRRVVRIKRLPDRRDDGGMAELWAAEVAFDDAAWQVRLTPRDAAPELYIYSGECAATETITADSQGELPYPVEVEASRLGTRIKIGCSRWDALSAWLACGEQYAREQGIDDATIQRYAALLRSLTH